MKLAYAHRSIMPYGNTNNRGLNFYDTSSDAKKSINVQTPKKDFNYYKFFTNKEASGLLLRACLVYFLSPFLRPLYFQFFINQMTSIYNLAPLA
jgi:hypothetical protein